MRYFFSNHLFFSIQHRIILFPKRWGIYPRESIFLLYFSLENSLVTIITIEQQIGHENWRLKIGRALSFIARSFPSHGRYIYGKIPCTMKKKEWRKESWKRGGKFRPSRYSVFRYRRFYSYPRVIRGIWNIVWRKDRPQLFRGFIVPFPPFFSSPTRDAKKKGAQVTETWAR